MSASITSPLQGLAAVAVLHCRHAATPVLQTEAAARWVLGHIAFNSGFEQRPGPANEVSRYRTRSRTAPGFELELDMHDGRFLLRSTPARRRLELRVCLGPGARHLRRNLPRLVEEFAAACAAEVVSLDMAGKSPDPRASEPALEPLVLPA